MKVFSLLVHGYSTIALENPQFPRFSFPAASDCRHSPVKWRREKPTQENNEVTSKKGRQINPKMVDSHMGTSILHMKDVHQICQNFGVIKKCVVWCVCKETEADREKINSFIFIETKSPPFLSLVSSSCIHTARTRYASGQKNLLIYAWNRGRVQRANLLVAKSSDCPAQLFSYVYVRKCAHFVICM